MNLRTLSLVVGALAAVSVGVYVINRPAPPVPPDPRVGQPLLDSAAVEKTAALRLVDQGKTIEVRKQADGSWIVPSYHDFPADFSKLSGLINELTKAKLQRLVTRSPESIKRLEFKDTTISLLDASGAPLVSLSLGKAPDRGGRYVRYGDEAVAFQADLNAWLDTAPKNWADSALLSLKATDIAKVELTFPEGNGAPLVATRAKKEDAFTSATTPEGQVFKPEKVTALLGSIGSIRFTETTEPTDANAVAARAHERVLTLTTFDGKTVRVGLGRKPEQKVVKAAPAKPEEAAAKLTELVTSATTAGATSASPTPTPLKTEDLTETIPAGPVFAMIAHSNASAPINGLMQKRAFQVSDFVYTSLPATLADFFGPAPTPTPTPTPASTPAPTPTPAPAPATK